MPNVGPRLVSHVCMHGYLIPEAAGSDPMSHHQPLTKSALPIGIANSKLSISDPILAPADLGYDRSFYPSETLIDIAENSKRVEHKAELRLSVDEKPRFGVSGLIGGKRHGYLFTASKFETGSLWDRNRKKSNKGSLSGFLVHIKKHPLPEGNTRPHILRKRRREMEDLNAASALLQFGERNGESNQLITIGSKGTSPGDIICFSTESYRRARSMQNRPNVFIFARKSIYPLLSTMGFCYISPLLSILWADNYSCTLYNYYHFLEWYSVCRRMPGTTYTLTDPREREGRQTCRKTFNTIGQLILDACIMNIAKHPLPEELRNALANVLQSSEPGDNSHQRAKFELLQSLLE